MKRALVVFVALVTWLGAATSVHVPLATSAVTISNASPAVVTWAAHVQVPGNAITFSTTGALPSPLVAGTTYYIISTGMTANSFQISETLNGAAINTTDAGSGVQTANTGLTWVFDADYTTGTYANGEPWVLAPSGLEITQIIPASTYTQTSSSTVTITNASPAVVSWTAHGLTTGTIVKFSTDGALPSPLVADQWYYVISAGLTTDSFRISAAHAGSAINTTTAGSGTHTGETGRIMHGSMTNPSSGTSLLQGYDTAMYSTVGRYYSASLNAGRPNEDDLSALNPMVVPAGTSIQSSISRTIASATSGIRPQLQDAAILTVVGTEPASGQFRPPLYGTDKAGTWNVSDLDYTILKSLAPVTGTPSLSTTLAQFTRAWAFWHGGSYLQYTMPVAGNPSGTSGMYGREVSQVFGNGILQLHLNYTNEQKGPLYIKLVQMGIDVFGAVNGGNGTTTGIFKDLAGIQNGKKAMLLLAGLALNDAAMLEYADATQHFIFSEDRQTFTIGPKQVSNVTISNASPAVVSWTGHGYTVASSNSMVVFTTDGALPDPLVAGTVYWVRTGFTADSFQISATSGGSAINTTTAGSGTHVGAREPYYLDGRVRDPYILSDTDIPEAGEQHTDSPQYDGRNWTSLLYRDIIGASYVGMGLGSALLTGGTATWNWGDFFLYCDRYVQNQITGSNNIPTFHSNMWTAYRGQYTPAALVWSDPYTSSEPEPPSGVPDAPTDLAAVASGAGAIILTWTDASSDEDGFSVERSPNGSTGWTTITVLGGDTETYTDASALLPGTEYFYRVLAYNADGSSDPSNTDSATTGSLGPGAPGTLNLQQ